MPDLLSTASELHRSGQLARAAELYSQVLARDEQNALALHGLGVLRHQQGDPAGATDLLIRAVGLRPDLAQIHNSLGEAFRALGQLEKSEECCRRAMALTPGDPETLCNLGLTLQALGRPSEAASQFTRAVGLRPEFAAAHTGLGLSLAALGRPDEALVHMRRAVELNPAFAPSRSNLGLMLLNASRAEEALAHCREAVRLRPDVAAFHHNLGNVLQALGRLPEAQAAYLEAVRLAPDFAPAHAYLGLVLVGQGQPREALTHLRRAVELDPGNATFQEHLGRLYGELQMHAEAIPCLQRSVELAPTAETHLALAAALYEEGRQSEVVRQCRAALALRPDCARAHVFLGAMHEELGELSEAAAALRAALVLRPDYPDPLARLTTLLRGNLPEADFVSLNERLADPRLEPNSRARLLFALGNVLDARGDFGGASEQIRQANALALEAGRGRRDYSAASHERFVAGLTQLCNADFFARLAGAGSDTRRPVFVFGFPRSGTSLIEQILASHSCVHGAGELRLVPQLFNAIPTVLNRADRPLDCLAYLDARCTQELADQHLDRLRAIDGGDAERIVDKTPDNYLYLGLLAVLFPRAVFIHCRRDLRDVALSCWMTDFSTLRWTNDVEDLASRVREYRRIMAHWSDTSSVSIEQVDYEEAVADLESVARRLVAACGLDWEPGCLEFHRTARPVRTASASQVRRPIYNSSVARWRNYERHLADLFTLLAK